MVNLGWLFWDIIIACVGHMFLECVRWLDRGVDYPFPFCWLECEKEKLLGGWEKVRFHVSCPFPLFIRHQSMPSAKAIQPNLFIFLFLFPLLLHSSILNSPSLVTFSCLKSGRHFPFLLQSGLLIPNYSVLFTFVLSSK